MQRLREAGEIVAPENPRARVLRILGDRAIPQWQIAMMAEVNVCTIYQMRRAGLLETVYRLRSDWRGAIGTPVVAAAEYAHKFTKKRAA